MSLIVRECISCVLPLNNMLSLDVIRLLTGSDIERVAAGSVVEVTKKISRRVVTRYMAFSILNKVQQDIVKKSQS